MIASEYPAGYLTLGEMYQQGIFGKAEVEKAIECYQKGAERGDEACQQALKKLQSSKQP